MWFKCTDKKYDQTVASGTLLKRSRLLVMEKLREPGYSY